MSCSYIYIWSTYKRLLTQLVKVTCSKTGLRQVDQRLPSSASCHLVTVRSLDHPAAVMVVLKATPFSARAEQLAALVLWLENTYSLCQCQPLIAPFSQREGVCQPTGTCGLTELTSSLSPVLMSLVLSVFYWTKSCWNADVSAGSTCKPGHDCLCVCVFLIKDSALRFF